MSTSTPKPAPTSTPTPAFETAAENVYEDAVGSLRFLLEVRNANEMRRQLEEAERERIRREERRLRMKVASLTADAQARVKEQRYAEALVLMKQILKLEPNNQAVLEQMRLLEQVDLLRRERGYEQDRSYHRCKY